MTQPVPGSREHTVVETTTADRFTELRLCRNMLRDHMPSRYERGLEKAYVTFLMRELEDRRHSQHGPAPPSDSAQNRPL